MFEIVRHKSRSGEVAYFNLFDENRCNTLMVCSAQRYHLNPHEADTGRPLNRRFTHVIAHVQNVQSAAHWYGSFLGIPLKESALQPDAATYCFSLERGANLLLSDTNANPLPRSYFQKINESVQVSPMAVIEARDIERAYRYIEDRGIRILGKIEPNANGSRFLFADPDGNVSSVSDKNVLMRKD